MEEPQVWLARQFGDRLVEPNSALGGVNLCDRRAHPSGRRQHLGRLSLRTDGSAEVPAWVPGRQRLSQQDGRAIGRGSHSQWPATGKYPVDCVMNVIAARFC